jgi:aryl-alcohol dehydrogenase-like predicted oxidoreductase
MMDLPKRILGRTGLEVTQLGFGTALRLEPEDRFGDDEAEGILHAVLDAGINFIDTAPDYGESEERIGRFISHRREEFYLATKCGCNIDADGARQDPKHLWTADRVRRNVDQSLARMKTDYVDLLQMHNPSVEEVEEGGLVEALIEIRQVGKTRFIGVSSTAPHLMTFAGTDAFDAFQVPYSALEPTHEVMIQQVADGGAGMIVRGGIAQGGRNQHSGRWDLWDRAGLDELAGEMSRYEFVLRFTLSHPACQTTIVGTTQPSHLRSNIAAAQAGPLPAEVYEQAKQRLAQIGEEPETSG